MPSPPARGVIFCKTLRVLWQSRLWPTFPAIIIRKQGFLIHLRVVREGYVVRISTSQYSNDISHMSEIHENSFYNCTIGVQANGDDGLDIQNCHVNQGIIIADNTKSVGFYLRGCRAQVLNNDLSQNSFGMVLTDNDQDGTLIAGNIIQSAKYAITAEGNNVGVDLKCNQLLNYKKRGFDIRQYATTAENGDLGHIGYCDLNQPAGNTFLPNWGAHDLYFGNNTNNLTYEDIGASSLTKGYEITNTGDCICVDCDVINIEEYCNEQGFFSIADIALITDDIRKNRELSKLLFYYIAENNYTAAYQLLHDYRSSMTDRYWVDEKMKEGEYATVDSLLENIPDAEDEQLQFKLYSYLLMNLKIDGRSLQNLNETELTTLRSIANSRTKTAFKAQTLLFAARGEQFPVELPIDDDTGTTWQTMFKTDDHTLPIGRISSFMPNPATNIAEIAYQINVGQTATLDIYNSNGQRISKILLENSGVYSLDTQSYPNGVYFCRISCNGIEMQSQKLVVIK